MTPYGPWMQVQTRRERAGLRQAELADLAGISHSYMSMLEDGNRWPSLKATVKLARALGVSAATIARTRKPKPCRKPQNATAS